MALLGTLTHRKTRRLARKLEIDECRALGVLEAMFHVAAEQHPPDGGIGRMSNQDIADEMFCRSIKPDKLINALLFAGQLEPNENCRLYIHHWDQHCVDWVDVYLARGGFRYANGQLPRMTRLEKRERGTLIAQHFSENDAQTLFSENHAQTLSENDAQTHANRQVVSHNGAQSRTTLALALPKKQTTTKAKSLCRLTPTERDSSLRSPTTKAMRWTAPQYMAWWNKHCGRLPKIKKLKRQRGLQLRGRLLDGSITPESFQQALAIMVTPEFIDRLGDEGIDPTFDWLIEKDNIEKVFNHANSD